MTSIEEIIKKSVNPFDSITWSSGNFWKEQQLSNLRVNSIHSHERKRIIRKLNSVEQDRQIRTILLTGDRGSGKTYLLGQLKQELSDRAFFAYIGPWADSDHIWRHILRYTVESLMHVPDGREESQLLLWLKGLSVFRDLGLMKKVLGERRLFIHNFKTTYPTDIYRANDFFSALYGLTNPDLYPIACDWLRGEDLDKEERDRLGIKKSISSETDAQSILANLCILSDKTQPIVLCFDQMDNRDSVSVVQKLLHINTTLKNERLHNLLIVVSLIKETWESSESQLVQADKDRIDEHIWLQAVNLDRIEEMLAKRLAPLHQQADPKPSSPLYPLDKQQLEQAFPGGKTPPRPALKFGSRRIREYKSGYKRNTSTQTSQKSTRVETDPIAEFKLAWDDQFQKQEQKIDRIRKFSSPELVKMLQEALTALEVRDIQPYLLESHTYRSHSFSFDRAKKRVGVIWNEAQNLQSFNALMKACEKVQRQQVCDSLILIRAEKLGSANNKGYKKFKQLFDNSSNQHIVPSLDSICYLATYHSFVTSANARELAIGELNPNLAELQSLTRESKVLHSCVLLQYLGIVPKQKVETIDEKIREKMLNIIKTQQLLGFSQIIDTTAQMYSDVDKFKLNTILEELIQKEDKIQILDESQPPKDRIICIASH